MIQTAILYIIFGCVWSLWLEWYTVKELEPPYNMPWSTRERLVHLVIWPWSFGLFLYTLFKDFFGNFFNE